MDFADAIGVLEDPAGLTREDDDASGEARYVTLGMAFTTRLLLVAWTQRDADTMRIISARSASRGEARFYRKD